jgi:hypothetical protein
MIMTGAPGISGIQCAIASPSAASGACCIVGVVGVHLEFQTATRLVAKK